MITLAGPAGPGVPGEGCRGNAALELAILAPVLLMLLCLVIAAGRASVAAGSVAAAARDAARQASIARTPAAAVWAAQESADAAIGQDHLGCVPVVRVNVAGFWVPVGQRALVTATVTCRVSFSDLLLPGMPGSSSLTATFSSPLDPYRGRVLGFSSSDGSLAANRGGAW
jgi:Flp pilus assembly protein TadG